jgi:hypothetical protein
VLILTIHGATKVSLFENITAVTTSIKLPDALKTIIAKVAVFENKTAHALMVDTLRAAIEDALARQQFYADKEAPFQNTLRTNAVSCGVDIKWAANRGGKPGEPAIWRSTDFFRTSIVCWCRHCVISGSLDTRANSHILLANSTKKYLSG